MKLLAIDTSSSSISAALVDDQGVIGQFGLHTGLKHSEVFLPLCQNLLQAAQLSLMDMDAFAVTIGPGSFTGLRIGLATAKAWVQATGKPLISISSLEALAALAAEQGHLLCPILDARRDQVYSALFRDGQRLWPDMAISVAELSQKLAAFPEPVIFSGDGLLRQEEPLRQALAERMHIAPSERRLFCAAAAGIIARDYYAKQQFADAATLEPHYLRLPEPEEQKLRQQKESEHEPK